jgi:hypothetical protein
MIVPLPPGSLIAGRRSMNNRKARAFARASELSLELSTRGTAHRLLTQGNMVAGI